MPLPDMTPQMFLSAAQEVIARMPGCVLVKNQVGNLAIVDKDDYQVGWVDLRYGEVTWYEDEDEDPDDEDRFLAGANTPSGA